MTAVTTTPELKALFEQRGAELQSYRVVFNPETLVAFRSLRQSGAEIGAATPGVPPQTCFGARSIKDAFASFASVAF